MRLIFFFKHGKILKLTDTRVTENLTFRGTKNKRNKKKTTLHTAIEQETFDKKI